MPQDEPDNAPDQANELNGPDDEVRCLVDRRPPDRDRERVGVVDLRERLTGHLPLEGRRHRIKTSLARRETGGGRRCELQPPRPLPGQAASLPAALSVLPPSS